MNFFGHAVIAHHGGAEQAAVLGAMLPDFAGMAGLRPPTPLEAGLQRGVALHHDTDRRFHAHPAFVALCADGVEHLTLRGVGRGPARASAHVGVELLLDGALSGDAAARDSYLRGIDHGLSSHFRDQLGWREPDGPARLAELLRRLRGAPLPQAYADPVRVGERLVALLQRRPRLALDEAAAVHVQRWIEAVQPAVLAHAPTLLGDLTDG